MRVLQRENSRKSLEQHGYLVQVYRTDCGPLDSVLISPGSAGIAELAIFHPVGILIKSPRRKLIPFSGRYNRETVDEQPWEGEDSQSIWNVDIVLKDLQITSASRLNNVIFKDYASAGIGRKFTSLFPGLGYAAGYKVQRNGWQSKSGIDEADHARRSCKEYTSMAASPSRETT